MAGTKVQLRRGTTTQHSSFTGAVGEVTVDTTKKTAVVHDGSTAGGFPLVRNGGSENVGIGTSPSTTLHVSSGSGARIRAGGATGSGFEFNDANTRFDIPAANSIAAYTSNTERMRIDSSGNVGIGTATIGAGGTVTRLQVANTNISSLGTQANLMITTTDAQSANIGGIIGLGGSVTTASPTANMRLFGAIRGAKDDAADGGTNGYLAFYTMGSSTITASERMRIDSSGNVGIGTNNPWAKVTIEGNGNQYVSLTNRTTGIAAFSSGNASGDNVTIGVYDRTTFGGMGTIYAGVQNTSTPFTIGVATGSNYNSFYTYPTPGQFAALTTAGSEKPAFFCRAWVNFNGTGTVAIRASGNVSSITDSGVGDYRVNFSTAMPDTNFAVSATGYDTYFQFASYITGTPSAALLLTYNASQASADDGYLSFAAFR